MTANIIGPGARLTELAARNPDEIAVIVARHDGGEDVLSRGTLERQANSLAHRLRDAGVRQGDFVAIILPNGVEHVVATLATYKLGGCPMPLNARMPAPERDALLALSFPVAIIGDAPELDAIRRAEIANLDGDGDAPPPDVTPQPSKAIASGGSSGKPKLIVSPGAFAFPGAKHPFSDLLQFRAGDLLYSPGPLYHNQAFFFSQIMLYVGGRILLNERFDARRALELVETHRPDILSVVPTMMQRMLHVPDVERRDLASVRLLWHMGAPCPDWVKRRWIDILGPERVWELWAATEVTGITTIDGRDWLSHPGSVGRGVMTDIRIQDEHGDLCPTGQVGEIFSRFAGGATQHVYKGTAPLPVSEDGFSSVGDLGWLDDEGYLYLADRRVDMIISGGANIFPAEVEAVLSDHPHVRDVVVVGVKDADLGRRVHAIIEPAQLETPPDTAELEALCEERLSRYKRPRSYEFIARLPRNEAGKVCRSQLRDERDAAHDAVVSQ